MNADSWRKAHVPCVKWGNRTVDAKHTLAAPKRRGQHGCSVGDDNPQNAPFAARNERKTHETQY